MQEARTRGALVALALLIFGGSGWALYRAQRRPTPPPVVITQAPDDVGARPAAPPPAVPAGAPRKSLALIYVHVAGAVKKPSLYALAPGSRVMQAVQAAGGPSPLADLDAVNLAERVRDGEKVYIPRRQTQAAPQAAMLVAPGNTLGHASVMPPASPPSAPPADSAVEDSAPAGTGAGGRPAGGRADKLVSPSEGHVNINTAGAAELQRLPGIGPAMAARIVAYRQQARGFHAIEDLQDVGGIGPKKFARIAPFVTLN